MDEVFVRVGGRQRYLWRAADQDGEVVDVLLQERRDSASARRFSRHLLAHIGVEPRAIVTDKLGSHAVARRERGMRRFKSMLQAQRLVGVHAAVSNLFDLARHLVAAAHYRTLRQSAFASWDRAVAI